MIRSPKNSVNLGVPSLVVLSVILGTSAASDAFARPAFGDEPAVGAKAPERSVEVPGAFKNMVSATPNPTSKVGGSLRRPIQKRDTDTTKIDVDENKGVSGHRAAGSTSKSKVISIPLSMLSADQLHEFNATAYCLRGKTASGHQVKQGIIAADPRVLPIGTVVHIEAGEYTGTYTVLDTGGAIKGHLIDVYVPTQKEAMRF